MSTLRIRLTSRLIDYVMASDDWKAWQSGRGVLPLDVPLFVAVVNAEPRKDGSILVDADPGLRATIHQWSLLLSYEKGSDENDRRANVRSARSVIRQIDPRAVPR